MHPISNVILDYKFTKFKHSTWNKLIQIMKGKTCLLIVLYSMVDKIHDLSKLQYAVCYYSTLNLERSTFFVIWYRNNQSL